MDEGTPSYPDVSVGVDAAVELVNAELGGIHGRPVVHDPHPGPDLARALGTVAATARRHGRDLAALGVQGRIDVHGPVDADRLRRGLDAWRAAGATHVSIHGTGQGRGAGPHVAFVHSVATVAEVATA